MPLTRRSAASVIAAIFIAASADLRAGDALSLLDAVQQHLSEPTKITTDDLSAEANFSADLTVISQITEEEMKFGGYRSTRYWWTFSQKFPDLDNAMIEVIDATRAIVSMMLIPRKNVCLKATELIERYKLNLLLSRYSIGSRATYVRSYPGGSIGIDVASNSNLDMACALDVNVFSDPSISSRSSYEPPPKK